MWVIRNHTCRCDDDVCDLCHLEEEEGVCCFGFCTEEVIPT